MKSKRPPVIGERKAVCCPFCCGPALVKRLKAFNIKRDHRYREYWCPKCEVRWRITGWDIKEGEKRRAYARRSFIDKRAKRYYRES